MYTERRKKYQKNKGKQCAEPSGCKREAYSMSFCREHYNAHYYRGKPRTTQPVQRRYAISEKGRATAQRWRDAHKAERKQYNRERFLREYGLTAEEYEERVRAQGGVCAICGKPQPGGKPLCVDHNHRTNKLRALLCHGCNLTVGFLEKDPVRTEKARMYLLQYQSPA